MSGGIPITDPVELAWCEFARRREETAYPGSIELRDQGLSIASFKAGVEWERAKHLSIAALEKALKSEERAACAELVRAAGCICDHMSWSFLRKPGTHHAGCPVTLAERIEARGRN